MNRLLLISLVLNPLSRLNLNTVLNITNIAIMILWWLYSLVKIIYLKRNRLVPLELIGCEIDTFQITRTICFNHANFSNYIRVVVHQTIDRAIQTDNTGDKMLQDCASLTSRLANVAHITLHYVGRNFPMESRACALFALFHE